MPGFDWTVLSLASYPPSLLTVASEWLSIYVMYMQMCQLPHWYCVSLVINQVSSCNYSCRTYTCSIVTNHWKYSLEMSILFQVASSLDILLLLQCIYDLRPPRITFFPWPPSLYWVTYQYPYTPYMDISITIVYNEWRCYCYIHLVSFGGPIVQYSWLCYAWILSACSIPFCKLHVCARECMDPGYIHVLLAGLE